MAVAVRKHTYNFNFKPLGPIISLSPQPLDFHNKLYIAPLTTLGNLPFRRLCVEFGADVTCSEMVLSKNILDSRSSEWALLRRHPSERCFGVQIAAGRETEAAAVCSLLRQEIMPNFVDLNAGCPMESLRKAGMGSGLMMKTGRLLRVVKTMLSNLQEIPLVVKTRIGDHAMMTHRLVPQIEVGNGREFDVECGGSTRRTRPRHCHPWTNAHRPVLSRSELGVIAFDETYGRYVKECALQRHARDLQVIGNGDVFDSEVCISIELTERRIIIISQTAFWMAS